MRATLAAARGVHAGRIVVVFQPHRYSRTRDLFDAFTTAFHDADLLVLTEIYGAGEQKIPGVEAARAGRGDPRARAPRRALRARPRARGARAAAGAAHGDLVMTLGAGSVSRLGPKLLQALVETRP